MELRALIEGSSDAERARLGRVLGVEPDGAQRLGEVELLLRGWFRRPIQEDRFAPEERHVLRLMLGERQGVARGELPAAACALIHGGFLFEGADGRVRMPDALRLCMPSTPSDPPNAARLLLPKLELSDARPLSATHYGRPVPGPVHAMLERPLGRLLDEDWVRQQVAMLEAAARRLFDAAVGEAGELSPAAIVQLEREPTRLSVGGAVVVPRRSQAYALARLGLLLPVPGRGWILPDEVYEAWTAAARAARAAELARLAIRDDEDEPLPSRVEWALSPGASAAALLAVLHQRGALREGVGVARAALGRAARQVGVPEAAAPVLVSVGRAAGLPFGAHLLSELDGLLWRTWRTTGAWNELQSEPDAFRPRARAASVPPVLRAVREALIETLEGLPPHRFATREEVLRAVTAAARVGGQREALAARILDESLPALGSVDVGESEGHAVLRATSRARAFWAGGTPADESAQEVPSRVDAPVRLPGTTPVRTLRTLARVGRLWVDGPHVAAELDPVELGLEAVSQGWELLSEQLARVWGMEPDAATFALQAMAVPSTKLPWRELGGAIHVPDPALRTRLLGDREAADLWVHAGQSGELLLVRAGASRARLERLLRKHGVVLA